MVGVTARPEAEAVVVLRRDDHLGEPRILEGLCPLVGVQGARIEGVGALGPRAPFEVRERVGVGAELGVVGSWSNYGMFSVNGYYHFADRSARVDPFVTGGYSLGFRSGTLNFGNFGGGVNLWLRESLGMRIEFRDHVHISSRVSDFHYWGIRLGVVFR